MAGRRGMSVSRSYKPEADACLRALTVLLQKHVKIEGSPGSATLANDGKIKEASADGSRIRH